MTESEKQEWRDKEDMASRKVREEIELQKAKKLLRGLREQCKDMRQAKARSVVEEKRNW